MLKHQPKQKRLSSLIELEACTQRSSDVKRLIQIAETLGDLDQLFSEALPEKLRGAFAVNTLKQGVLSVTCHSASLATRFRLEQAQILKRFNMRSRQQAKRIDIRIRPSRSANKPQQSRRSMLSNANAQLLCNEADHTEDQKLKRALERLARNAQEH